MNRGLSTTLVLALATTLARPAHAEITRTEVIDRAKAYTFYPWRATAANLSAPCDAAWDSAFVVGDYLGVAYDWGGFDSLFQFSQKISSGYAAGSPAGGAVSACTTGVDCSGFVSRTWNTASKYGTATLPNISSQIAVGAMLPGDVFNDPNNHVTLFSHTLASGAPYMYEAFGFNTRVNAFGGWSWVNGYVPRRYNSITGTTATTPVGTPQNPIVVGALPYTDSRDTRTAPTSVLDGCGAAPGTNESGPEYVYRVQVTQPGQLTVAVSDDVGVDVDVHLYTSPNTSDCVARADASFTYAVDCGTYYVVADTYGGVANAGLFDLTITHTPNGQPCGSGPPSYDPLGQPGDACAFPGNPNLPGCNATLDGEVCLYTSGAGARSFCTMACATDTDCSAMPGGGCCQDIGSGERYCMVADLCATEPGGGGGGTDAGPDAGTGSGSGSGGAGGAPDESQPGGCAIADASPAPLALWLIALALVTRRRRSR